MIAERVLGALREAGLCVSADGEDVLCVGPRGALTPDLRGRVAECKPALLALLRAERRRAQGVAPVQLALRPPSPARGARETSAASVAGLDPLEIDAMRCALFDGARTPAQLRALVAERRAGSRKPVTFALLGVAARTTLDRATDEDLRRALTGLADPPEGT